MRFFANANYDFISLRRKAYVGSAVLLALTILTAIVWQFREDTWLDYGIDFLGGTLVQVRFEQPTSVAELRELIAARLGRPEVTRFGGENEFLIRAREFTQEEGAVSDLIVATLTERYGDGAFAVVRTESVGAKVGSELQQKAILAILLAFSLTLVYLAFRFEWRFGVAAVIATFHDIVLTLGLLAAVRLEISLATVAAVLTIIGYSLNDTIVVFDRARENLKKFGRKESYKYILNRSINETLPRTVLTSGTTLVALLSLFVLGGPIIRDFALILLFGILIGTYSSIFVASPALLEIERRWPSKERRGKTDDKLTTRPGTRSGAAAPQRSGV
jgi:preprotein translocase subunit SecF